MRVMSTSTGDGYKYLLRTVASGDGDRDLSTPLPRYYAEEGIPTPPGGSDQLCPRSAVVRSRQVIKLPRLNSSSWLAWAVIP